jgi:hypothetical protein
VSGGNIEGILSTERHRIPSKVQPGEADGARLAVAAQLGEGSPADVLALGRAVLGPVQKCRMKCGPPGAGVLGIAPTPAFQHAPPDRVVACGPRTRITGRA